MTSLARSCAEHETDLLTVTFAQPLSQLTYFHDDVMEKIEELCKNAPDLSEM